VKYRAANPTDMVWFGHMTQYKGTEDMGGIVAMHDDGTVAGMVAFDHWTPKSVHGHMAVIDPRCTRGLWREVVKYLRQHGKEVIIGMTPSHIDKAVRLIKRGLKWTEVARIKDGWDTGSDMVITEYRL
jgi:hypothetical protein